MVTKLFLSLNIFILVTQENSETKNTEEGQGFTVKMIDTLASILQKAYKRGNRNERQKLGSEKKAIILGNYRRLLKLFLKST